MTKRAVGQIARVVSPLPPPLLATLRALRPGAVSSGINVNWGGNFKVAGTVKEAGSPNKPVYRRVVLHDQLTGLLVQSVWSNPTTGTYSFDRIKTGLYYVVSFDYTGNFRAVIADNQVPEPM